MGAPTHPCPPATTSHHPPALLLASLAGWSSFLGLPAPILLPQGVAVHFVPVVVGKEQGYGIATVTGGW